MFVATINNSEKINIWNKLGVISPSLTFFHSVLTSAAETHSKSFFDEISGLPSPGPSDNATDLLITQLNFWALIG